MSKGIVQEKDIDITELVEAFSLDDEIELDNDIREWLQTPPVQLKDFGYEPDSEGEYFAILNEISEYLMER
ncbi:hypothetical protein [Schinkia azotoformans]|uniref:hypothetical protein n=1 Tax=Schinkia azotoformans TaxID=1454 RepID=UPI002DB6E03B|nr:hypothetical protein [Schinkia azotoformans]MEC1723094.1 hypothetical protein [Schinkia azotoformans]MED4415886.1 hypothetical protein [Schinkia azotoformans]